MLRTPYPLAEEGAIWSKLIANSGEHNWEIAVTLRETKPSRSSHVSSNDARALVDLRKSSLSWYRNISRVRTRSAQSAVLLLPRYVRTR